MKKRLGFVFWVESILASVTAFLTVVTLIWPRWVETAFAIDPDHGDSSFEWKLVVVLGVSASLLAVMARRELRKTSQASA